MRCDNAVSCHYPQVTGEDILSMSSCLCISSVGLEDFKELTVFPVNSALKYAIVFAQHTQLHTQLDTLIH